MTTSQGGAGSKHLPVYLEDYRFRVICWKARGVTHDARRLVGGGVCERTCHYWPIFG